MNNNVYNKRDRERSLNYRSVYASLQEERNKLNRIILRSIIEGKLTIVKD
jgi:hypothetical protein